jgi:hypothetical protein
VAPVKCWSICQKTHLQNISKPWPCNMQNHKKNTAKTVENPTWRHLAAIEVRREAILGRCFYVIYDHDHIPIFPRCWDTWGEYLRFFLYLYCKFFLPFIMVVLTLNVAQLVGGGYCCRSSRRCRAIGYLEVIAHPLTVAADGKGFTWFRCLHHFSFYWHILELSWIHVTMFLPVLNKTRCCSTAFTKSLAPGIGNSQQVQKIRLFIVALRRHDSLGPPWSSRPCHDMSCISCVQLRFRIRPKLRDNYWNETVLWRISRRIDHIDVRGGYGGFIMFQCFIIDHDWLLHEGVWTAWVALQLVFSSTLWNVHELLRLFLGHSNTRRVIYLLAEPMAVSHPEKISAHDNGVSTWQSLHSSRHRQSGIHSTSYGPSLLCHHSSKWSEGQWSIHWWDFYNFIHPL